ncbi:probable inactive serine/threonine-protein kinase fnkC [Capsella rubella]|uniref:probable inactive serine/threonine-protein kinase fnkC n=1 Tax=Capsella rubella TaxID=81985 RepID=UPI000CD51689|nr:probable inactive serine/threonine-protein kinase fnkC [Capsella rubella]
MAKLVNDGYYESLPFTSGGFNWTFKIYPNGNKKDAAAPGWVSVYVKIDNSFCVTNPQDVYAEIKFFLYNGVTRLYYTHQESEPVKFDDVKPEWGFGVDIFVTHRSKREVFSYDVNVTNPIYTWCLPNFSTLCHCSYTSHTFCSGDRNWVLKVYPNGDGCAKDKYLSLYLLSVDNEINYVKATLRVLNQTPCNNVVKPVEGWPKATCNNGWGFQEFIALADLKDPCKGFLVNDVLRVQVEITAFSKHTPLN